MFLLSQPDPMLTLAIGMVCLDSSEVLSAEGETYQDGVLLLVLNSQLTCSSKDRSLVLIENFTKSPTSGPDVDAGTPRSCL